MRAREGKGEPDTAGARERDSVEKKAWDVDGRRGGWYNCPGGRI